MTQTVAFMVVHLLFLVGCTGEGRFDRPPTSPRASAPDGKPGTSPRKLFWVAAENAKAVVQVDPVGASVLRNVSLSGSPHNITVGPDGTVAATTQGYGRVILIRGDEIKEIRLGGSPHDVKASSDSFVVANEGAARLDLLLFDGSIHGRIALKQNPHDVAVSQDGKTAWVSLDGSDEIAVVDLLSRQVSAYLPTGNRPHDLLQGPEGAIWATDWSGDLFVYSPQGQAVRKIALVKEAHHLAFTPDGREAWVTDHGAERVFIVSTSDLNVVAELPIGGAPHHVAISPDGKYAAVADHSRGLLLIFDARSRQELTSVEVGGGPHGVSAFES
jgi:YVTN family beta-propeller protein